MNKKELRACIKDKKKQMTEEEISRQSEILCRKFLQSELYRSANTVFVYLSYNQEVRTAGIVLQALADGKTVAAPKVIGEEMKFIRINGLEDVAKGYCGIPEPVMDEPVITDEDALILMPGLAFDRNGRRCGYGGGFYDRYLEEHPNHKTVALCYDFQLFDRIETESHDKPVDLVLSTKE